jgi:hypothetical protein
MPAVIVIDFDAMDSGQRKATLDRLRRGGCKRVTVIVKLQFLNGLGAVWNQPRLGLVRRLT